MTFAQPAIRSARQRTRLARAIGAFLIALVAFVNAWAADWRDLLTDAGNAHDERERYRLLRTLETAADIPETMRNELSALLVHIGYWVREDFVPGAGPPAPQPGDRLGFFFGREGLDEYMMPRIPEQSPLYPLYCLYRGRMLIQTIIQSRGPGRPFAEWTREGRTLLSIARESFPENRIVRMYLDEPFEGWPQTYTHDDAAPEWANLQREGLEALADVIHWWIHNRQRPDGSFGGGWGDDVEMWRWWAPLLIGFADPIIESSQVRLSRAVFAQPHMSEGYTSVMTDVEHSSEDSTDALLPMLHLNPDDPVWKERTLRIVDLARERWMGLNSRGRLQFKSVYFNAHRVSPIRSHAADTAYHVRVLQPALLLWQRTNDPRLDEFFSSWMRTWAEATLGEERGKPTGVPPSAIRWPDGASGGIGENWWRPEIDSQGHLYDWPGALGLVANAMAMTHLKTGNPKLLEALEAMWALMPDHGASTNPDAEPGSLEWIRARMKFARESQAKHRAAFARAETKASPSPNASEAISDRVVLTKRLRINAQAFRNNWAAYTTECRWTDRVLGFGRYYANAFLETPWPLPNPDLLYSTATGDPGSPVVTAFNAVRWYTEPRKIAALVTKTGQDGFSAELFHFGSSPRLLAAEFLLLRPGNYTCTLTTEAGAVLEEIHMTLTDTNRRTHLELPARQLCFLAVTPRAN